MRRYCFRILLAALALALFANAAPAQTARAQKLENTLRERDKVITELLERVEALERRIGIRRSVRDGGPAAKRKSPPKRHATSAPGAIAVSEDDAERALERTLAREGALLLRSGTVEIEPSLTFSRREDRTPAFVTSGSDTLAAQTERNSNRLTAGLALRVGLPWRSQLEIGVPYRARRDETVTNAGFSPVSVSDNSGAGFGDLRVGLATTLAREGLWRPDIVGRVTWDTATAHPSDGGVSLGGGFHEITGSLSAIKRQDPVAFVGSLSYGRTLEADSIQPGPVFAANFGTFLAISPETSLRMVLSGAYRGETELSGVAFAGSDQTIASFIIGGSTLLAPGTLLNLTAAIGLTDDADDFSIMLSLPVRFGSVF